MTDSKKRPADPDIEDIFDAIPLGAPRELAARTDRPAPQPSKNTAPGDCDELLTSSWLPWV